MHGAHLIRQNKIAMVCSSMEEPFEAKLMTRSWKLVKVPCVSEVTLNDGCLTYISYS